MPRLLTTGLLLGAVLIGSTHALFALDERTQEHFHKWNTLSQCWGEESMIEFYRNQQIAVEGCRRAVAIQIPQDVNLLQDFYASHPMINILKQHVRMPEQPPKLPQMAQIQQRVHMPRDFPPEASNKVRSAANALPAEDKPYGRRHKRSEGLNSVEEHNKQELQHDYTQFRWSLATKLGNLSCVMTQLGMLDDEGNVNKAYYMSDIWERQGQSLAARDPIFVEKLKEGVMDCHSLAESWPQRSLDRSPLYQMYGRLIIFFKCVAEEEVKMCTKFQAKQWLEKLYGRMDTSVLTEAAADPYEKAAMVMKLKYETATPEEDAVERFFWGTPDLE
jgi:hypothetical protein